MTRKRRILMMPPCAPVPCLLLLLLWGLRALAVCPSVCLCNESHREVDCSWRGLRQLPHDLQHDVRSLNLSHNRLTELEDARLAAFTHLRSLDVSHNRLARLPAALPRALWELRAAGNRLQLLEKNHTAYQWNLRALDLSANRLERVVFINNTLPGLRWLNLSHNRFWTVPTNMPRNLEMVDLSHNTLVQILPGSLARLGRLRRLYLHANRFSWVGAGVLEPLVGLQLISLGENPWACSEPRNVSHLLAWLRSTPARVLGCPCLPWHACGEARLARTGGWHFATYPLPPRGTTGAPEHSRPPAQAVTTGYRYETDTHSAEPGEDGRWQSGFPPTPAPDALSTTDDHFTTSALFTTSTRRTTTLRTRSVKRANQGVVRSTSPELGARPSHTVTINLLLLTSIAFAKVL